MPLTPRSSHLKKIITCTNHRERNRYIADLEIETLLRAQLDEHKQIIKQLQTEVATKNVALENVTVGMEDRMVDKAREMERVIKERDEHSDARRRLEQEKLVLEIKVGIGTLSRCPYWCECDVMKHSYNGR